MVESKGKFYKSSNPEKVMELYTKVIEQQHRAEQVQGMRVAKVKADIHSGRYVTVLHLVYQEDLTEGEPGYWADISWNGWPDNKQVTLPADQEFHFIFPYNGPEEGEK